VKSDGRRALGIISEANASDIPWNWPLPDWPKMQTMMKSPWGPMDYTLGILRNVNIRGDAWRGLIFVDNHRVQMDYCCFASSVPIFSRSPCIDSAGGCKLHIDIFCTANYLHAYYPREWIVNGNCEGSRIMEREWANMRVITWASI